jgi:peroxiredoxin
MDSSGYTVLGPGDPAPDFELPAADTEGTVALADYRRRGPVLLTLLRALYCPFCRRHIGLLRPT